VDKIYVLTDRRYAGKGEGSTMPAKYVANVLLEDRLVVDALCRAGFDAERVAWCDAEVDWASARACLFRTTWDYFERWPEFSTWLEHTSRVTSLLNPPHILKWNLDKHYLRDLDEVGCNVVPTRFVRKGTLGRLQCMAEEHGWAEVVIKPAVAGAAINTYRIHLEERRCAPRSDHGFEELWARLIREQDMLIQPFLPDVVEAGELSLVWIGGEVTHAVRKQAKEGDFRVQDDHGGTVTSHRASPDELEFARAAMKACESHCQNQGWPLPLYARVDMVRDPAGAWAVSELEMVEPELWFRFCPEAAETLSLAVKERLGV
jgi:hypothetical protein